MPADGRLPLDKLSGAGASVGNAPIWTGTRWAPGSAGGGLLGYGYLTFAFPDIDADGTIFTATSSAGPSPSGGTLGVSQSSGTITYCTDNVESFYLICATVSWTGVTGGAASDVFAVSWNDLAIMFLQQAMSGVNTDHGGPSFSNGTALSASAGDPPELRALCPSGSGRTLTGVAMQYEILRFSV